MFAKLTALVGGGYTFGYNVSEEPYPDAWGQWTHHQGTSKEDGSPVSVFKMMAADPNDRRLACARNGVKRLKMLRHPNVLAYKDSTELQEKGQTVLYLVTQPVKPLKLVLDELNLSGQQRDEYLAMGILHMTNAVSFLNNDCKLIHGNICLNSVVVTETLDWKLHGFDLLSEHSLPADQCLMHASWMVGAQYKAGELGKGDWDTIRDSPPWAVDAWGLGCLIQEVFSQEPLTSVEQLRRTAPIPQALLGDYQKLLSSNPSRRLNPAKVAESKFLNNRLVDVVNFMENIAVKDSTDKDTFFKRMGTAIPLIPPEVSVRKILPMLSNALEFGGAPPSAVGPLLQIGNTLPSDDFNKRVVPTLSKLFSSTDRSIRRSLLESMDTYSHHLTTAVLEDQIYVHLQTGFTDGNAYIRELTLKSILPLAPKLSNKTLVNNVLKHLSKLQVDEEASIRANTTVLLGNIAKYLGESTCKRVLLNAFTRALKDGFPPAKIAGLRAMVATQQYHGPEDMAMRILPSVAPLTLDPVAEVRASALQVLDVFVAGLKEAEERRAQELATSSDPALGSGAAAGTGTGSALGLGANVGSSLASGAGTALGWAMSSLITSTGLGVKATGAAAGAPGAPATTAAPTASTSAKPAEQSRGAGSTASGASSSRQSGTGQDSGAAGQSAKTDGWGDGDGWEQDEDLLPVDDAEAQARARLTAKPSTSKPAATRTSRPASSAASDGWDNASAGGWEGGEVSAPAATTSSRPASGAQARPARGTSGSGAAGGTAKKPGAMKLGASKLGASKINTELKDFDDDKW